MIFLFTIIIFLRNLKTSYNKYVLSVKNKLLIHLMDCQLPNITENSFLDGKLSIFQPIKGFRAGLDSVLLAASVNAQSGEKVLEIGAGVGTVLFCLMNRISGLEATGIEIMEEYHTLSLINAKRNKINANLILGDFFTYENLKKKNFDQIFFNPPYYPVSNYKISDNKLLDIANIEYPGILKRMLNFSLKRCKPYGYITLIHRPARISDILSILKNGAGDIKILPIVSSNSKSASRIIIRARKSAKGDTKLLNPLFLYKDEKKIGQKKQYTSEIHNILRNGYGLNF